MTSSSWEIGMPKSFLTCLTVVGSPVFCISSYQTSIALSIIGMPTLVISSLIFTVGLPSTDESLITMFRALLFSVPPLDFLLKSFESDVPMPKAPVRYE